MQKVTHVNPKGSSHLINFTIYADQIAQLVTSARADLGVGATEGAEAPLNNLRLTVTVEEGAHRGLSSCKRKILCSSIDPYIRVCNKWCLICCHCVLSLVSPY